MRNSQEFASDAAGFSTVWEGATGEKPQTAAQVINLGPGSEQILGIRVDVGEPILNPRQETTLETLVEEVRKRRRSNQRGRWRTVVKSQMGETNQWKPKIGLNMFPFLNSIRLILLWKLKKTFVADNCRRLTNPNGNL